LGVAVVAAARDSVLFYLVLQIIRPIQSVERYERDREQQSGVFVDLPRQHRVGFRGRRVGALLL